MQVSNSENFGLYVKAYLANMLDILEIRLNNFYKLANKCDTSMVDAAYDWESYLAEKLGFSQFADAKASNSTGIAFIKRKLN